MSERSITQQVLGKSIDQLTYTDLVKYFSKPRGENDRIEFKSYVVGKNDKGPKAHLEEVYESLSALLNSEGGLLIWGAPKGEYPPESKEKVFIGQLTDVQCDRDDDQLNSGILDNLSPMPPNIRHRKLTKGSSRAYVFEVPKSPYAPHQLKGTYYARFGAQTRVAPHYLVEALMRRVTFPNIAATIELRSVHRESHGVTISFTIVSTNRSRFQNEREITVTAVASHGSFPRNLGTARNIEIGNKDRVLIISNARELLHFGITHSLQFDLNVLDHEIPPDGEVYLQVAIGGRFSPMKYSTYAVRIDTETIDLSSRLRTIKEAILPDERDDSFDPIPTRRMNRTF